MATDKTLAVQHCGGGVGGVHGFEDCIRACQLTHVQIRKLDPDERDDLMSIKEWLGDWRPDEFDLEAAKRDFER